MTNLIQTLQAIRKAKGIARYTVETRKGKRPFAVIDHRHPSGCPHVEIMFFKTVGEAKAAADRGNAI